MHVTATSTALDETVRRALPRATADRHHLHRNPEVSRCEERTAAYVAARLGEIGVDSIATGVGGHGIVASIVGAGASTQHTVALRADMDALPITEIARHDYVSLVPGVMHACGHDGHTAVLLGAATVLAETRAAFSGRVVLIFQPAEEIAGGAKGMIEGGALDGVDAIAALHGWPGLEPGRIAVRPGPMMASADTFDLTITGRGGHAAQPHLGVDPIALASQIVSALQTVVSREVSPTEPAVVSVTQFHAGSAYNVIPDSALLRGTVRCLTEEMRRDLASRIDRIAGGICSAGRGSHTFEFHLGTPVTINDPRVTGIICEAARNTLGPNSVDILPAPSMGAEDFAEYCRVVPGAMFRLGVGRNVTALHTPQYDFGDSAIAPGISMLCAVALRLLQGIEPSPCETEPAKSQIACA